MQKRKGLSSYLNNIFYSYPLLIKVPEELLNLYLMKLIKVYFIEEKSLRYF